MPDNEMNKTHEMPGTNREVAGQQNNPSAMPSTDNPAPLRTNPTPASQAQADVDDLSARPQTHPARTVESEKLLGERHAEVDDGSVLVRGSGDQRRVPDEFDVLSADGKEIIGRSQNPAERARFANMEKARVSRA